MATLTDPRNPIKTRKATRPASGFCRWLSKPNAHHEGGRTVTCAFHPFGRVFAAGNEAMFAYTKRSAKRKSSPRNQTASSSGICSSTSVQTTPSYLPVGGAENSGTPGS